MTSIDGTVALLLITTASVLPAQAAPAYSPARLDGAVFVESIRTDGTSQSGAAERKWSVTRAARFRLHVDGDTIVVSADSLALQQLADGTQHEINVDPVVGGRWTMMIARTGAARVFERPFVPAAIADVSDIGTAMNDFLPPAPPLIAPGKQLVEGSGRVWRQLPDSSSLTRYHWEDRARRDSSYVTADSVAINAIIETHENGWMAWDKVRGPAAWHRTVESTVDTRYAGRTVRAVVMQQIVVQRAP